MSARPDVPRLAGEELDLLISRSLDGDLSPDEEQQLERLVAADPAAARRKAELAALVADVKALPEPAPPFALATRVNTNVAERAGRPGSLGGRVGFFPAPGFAKAALVVLAIVAAAIAILRPAPKHVAEGPVDVLLLSPAQPASPPPRSVIAESRPAPPARDEERRQERDALQKEAPAGESGEKRSAAKLEHSGEAAPGPSAPSNLVADGASKQKSDLDGGVAVGGAVAPQASARIAAVPAPALRAKASEVARGWTISVVGEGARRWALRRAPDTYPAPATGGPVVYRVALDANGAVAALRAVGTSAADPRLDEFVRGMVFEPLPRAEGALRERKDAPAPAAPASHEIEIELAPR